MPEPRLISIWNGNGFYFKTYQGADDYYYTVVTSPDFATENEALAFNENASQYFVRYNRG
jgi:hypothetical protein